MWLALALDLILWTLSVGFVNFKSSIVALVSIFAFFLSRLFAHTDQF